MEAIRKAILAGNENFMAAFKQGDAARVAALYTKDARLLPPNSQMVTGTENIQAFWQGAKQLTYLLLVLLLNTAAYGQAKDEKVFAIIPADQRSRLIKRLNQYIKYKHSGQQEKLYDLYDEKTLCSLCKGKSECVEDCLPPMKLEVPEGFSTLLVELKPRSVEPIKGEAGRYKIKVDMKERVSWKGKAPHIVKKRVSIEATLQNNNWFFSLIAEPGVLML